MKINEDKLKFYVLLFDLNRKEADMFNIFDNIIVREDIINAINKKVSKEELKEILSSVCKYEFWSRYEYEVVVTGLLSNKKSEKIDAWFQIEPNLDIITEYLWQEFINKQG